MGCCVSDQQPDDDIAAPLIAEKMKAAEHRVEKQKNSQSPQQQESLVKPVEQRQHQKKSQSPQQQESLVKPVESNASRRASLALSGDNWTAREKVEEGALGVDKKDQLAAWESKREALMRENQAKRRATGISEQHDYGKMLKPRSQSTASIEDRIKQIKNELQNGQFQNVKELGSLQKQLEERQQPVESASDSQQAAAQVEAQAQEQAQAQEPLAEQASQQEQEQEQEQKREQASVVPKTIPDQELAPAKSRRRWSIGRRSSSTDTDTSRPSRKGKEKKKKKKKKGDW